MSSNAVEKFLGGANRPRKAVVNGKPTRFNGRPAGTYKQSASTEVLYVDSNVAVGREMRNYSRNGGSNNTRIWVDPTVNFGDKSAIEKIAATRATVINAGKVAAVAIPLVSLGLSIAFSWWFLVMMVPMFASLAVLAYILDSKIHPILPTVNSLSRDNENWNGVGVELAEVLESSPNAHQITAQIRNKYIDMGDEPSDATFYSWLATVIKIFKLDPAYDPELIPLMNGDASTVLVIVQEYVRAARDKAERERLAIAAIDQETAAFKRGMTVEQSKELSQKTLARALERLEERSKLEEMR